MAQTPRTDTCRDCAQTVEVDYQRRGDDVYRVLVGHNNPTTGTQCPRSWNGMRL